MQPILENNNINILGTYYEGEYHPALILQGPPLHLPSHEISLSLDCTTDSLKKSESIIIGLSSNYLKYFFKKMAEVKDFNERKAFIKIHTPLLFNALQLEYVEAIDKIRALNSDSKIIFVTQPYPAFSSLGNQYDELIIELGSVLNLGRNPHDPTDVLYEIMKNTYAKILNAMTTDAIVIADIASSYNPFNQRNYKDRFTPSKQGENQISQMINYVISSGNNTNMVYQFLPNFFHAAGKGRGYLDKYIDKISLHHWELKHPHDFTNLACHDLLYSVLKEADHYVSTSTPMHQACIDLYENGTHLLNSLTKPEDLLLLKESLNLGLDVIKNPHDTKAVNTLRWHAWNKSIGKASLWQAFVGGLLTVASIAVSIISVTAAPLTSGGSLLGLSIAGALAVSGIGLFYNGREKAVAKNLIDITEIADPSFTATKTRYAI
ncbi:MAG: hypothetical protein H0W64_09085 [Gammaproteobacteria bacterium]|nr:hypothetical protein [Gammaproteobacteria bacterium]